MSNHLNHHSNNDTVVVYHSRREQMTDEFLWEEGGFVYICVLMLAVAVIATSYDKIRTAVNRSRWERNELKNKFKNAKWR
jgi:hypothetical protein